MGDRFLERRERFSGRSRIDSYGHHHQEQWFQGREENLQNSRVDSISGRRTYAWGSNGFSKMDSGHRRRSSNRSFNRFNQSRYLGPFLNDKTISIRIESKQFELQVSDFISISELKNHRKSTISFNPATAIWIGESLSKKGWSSSKYEGNLISKLSWESNNFGDFVRLSAGFGNELSHICIPVGINLAGLRLFAKALNESIKLQSMVSTSGSAHNLSASSVEIDPVEAMMFGFKDKHQEHYSISSALLERDIVMASNLRGVKQIGYVDAPTENEETEDDSEKEEMQVLKLFHPIFDVFFNNMFDEVENQIKEELARTELGIILLDFILHLMVDKNKPNIMGSSPALGFLLVGFNTFFWIALVRHLIQTTSGPRL